MKKPQIREDDRTAQQRQELAWAIAGTDSFLSGWGLAEHGVSVAAWACRYEDLGDVERWVRSRGEMRRVRRVFLPKWRPTAAHVHVYVWSRRGVDRKVTS